MLEPFSELMNHFKAGDVIIALAVCIWLAHSIYNAIKMILDKNSAATQDAIRKEEMLNQMKEDIETASRDISRIQTEMNQQLQNLNQRISDNVNDKIADGETRLEEMISELHSIVDAQSEKINGATQRLDKIEQDIKILFRNDSNAYREGIEAIYKKYVDGNEPIPLEELKRVEDLYNNYREQNNGQYDAMLDTMVTRIRSLPTVKRNNEGQ